MPRSGSEQQAALVQAGIVEKVGATGLAYIHSSGCAVLKDGTWLQPEEWAQWLAHLEIVEEES